MAGTEKAAASVPCGVCSRPAVWMATVPMCGERPRYPLCEECLDDIAWCEYAEDVDLIDSEVA